MASLADELDDGTPVEIALASRDVLGDLAEIYNEYIKDEIATFGGHEIDEKFFDRYFSKDGRDFLLVAKLNEVPIGWTAVQHISDRWAYRFTGLTSMYVRKGLAAKNVGSSLKLAQMNKALEVGFHSLVCEVLSNNPKTINFNEKFGYEIVGEIKEAGYRNGEWIGLTVMQKIISNDNPVERRVTIRIQTADLPKSIELYNGILGLGMRPRSQSMVSFPFGEVELEVVKSTAALTKAGPGNPSLNILAKSAAHFRGIQEFAADRGYSIIAGDDDCLMFTDLNQVSWSVSFKDDR